MPTDFYVAGGTLPGDAVSYVRRQADEVLYLSLCRHEYCYVLTSRQMGKSSLMVRTAARLRAQGIQTAVVDLTSLGQNVTVEQWYKGILNRIGQAFGIEEMLDDFWYDQAALPPLERWLDSLTQVAQALSPQNVVLFIDEIDMVRSLAFNTDEFFAGIRACYNRREQSPDLCRLTVCLLGVASPSDLVQNSHITPFNIGRRIELHDFTLTEATFLATGIALTGRDAMELMRRIFYWTGGQPYLTQRLCAAVATDSDVQEANDVDRLCRQLFFSREAQQNELNLAFVRDRLMKSGQDVAALLDLYRRLLKGRKPVAYDPVAALCETLRLSGIARVTNGWLMVRNRIYRHVFDDTWVGQNMPDAERRRQTQAYRRGVVRTLAAASLLIASLGAMLLLTLRSEKRAREALTTARQERDNANRQLYTSDMNLAQRAYEEGNIERAEQLLHDCDSAALRAYRGFEWRYLWGQLHQDLRTLTDQMEPMRCATFAPDGSLVTVDTTGTVRHWSAETGVRRNIVLFHYERMSGAALSRNARMVAIATDTDLLRVHDTTTGREIRTLSASYTVVSALAFSPDGRLLAAGALDGTVTLWNIADGTVVRRFATHKSWIDTLVFSPDGRTLASSSRDGAAWLEEVLTGRRLSELQGNTDRIRSLAFSKDGRLLATGGEDGALTFWNAAQGTLLSRREAHQSAILALALSPDGHSLATGGRDTTVKLWDVAAGAERCTLAGHKKPVQCLAFAPDGRRLFTGSDDITLKIWDIASTLRHQLGVNRSLSLCAAFAPDGGAVVTANADHQIVLWDVKSGLPKQRITGLATVLDMSPTGRYLLHVDQTGLITLNDCIRRNSITTRLGKKPIWAATFAPHEDVFAAAGKGSTIYCANVRTGVSFRTLPTDFLEIASLTFSEDGHLLGALSTEGALRVLDYKTGAVLFTSPPSSRVASVFCFSPHGDRLAIGFADGTVELWSLKNGRKIWEARGHTARVSAITFSPSDDNIATGSDDHLVHLWNVHTGSEVWTLNGHTERLSKLKFTADRRALVSIDQSRTVLIWRAPLLETIQSSPPPIP